MNDRELLELAAKAAGLQVKPRTQLVNDSDGVIAIYVRNGWNDRYQKWGPLEDDGDTLRLAVKLGLHIMQHISYVSVLQPYGNAHMARTFFTESYHDDPYAATRRAIVRAAAEIGRAMP